MALRNGTIKINGQLSDLIFHRRGIMGVVRQKATHKQQIEASKKPEDLGT